jgi:hypothetical protein
MWLLPIVLLIFGLGFTTLGYVFFRLAPSLGTLIKG